MEADHFERPSKVRERRGGDETGRVVQRFRYWTVVVMGGGCRFFLRGGI